MNKHHKSAPQLHMQHLEVPKPIVHELFESAALLVFCVVVSSSFILSINIDANDKLLALQQRLYLTIFSFMDDELQRYLHHFLILTAISSGLIFVGNVIWLQQRLAILQQFCHIAIWSHIILLPLKLVLISHQHQFGSNSANSMSCPALNHILLQAKEMAINPASPSIQGILSNNLNTPPYHTIVGKTLLDTFVDYVMYYYTHVTYIVSCSSPYTLSFLQTTLVTICWFYLFQHFYITSLSQKHDNPQYKSLQDQSPLDNPIVISISHAIALILIIIPITILSLSILHPIDTIYSILIPLILLFSNRLKLENLYHNSFINVVISHSKRYSGFVISHGQTDTVTAEAMAALNTTMSGFNQTSVNHNLHQADPQQHNKPTTKSPVISMKYKTPTVKTESKTMAEIATIEQLVKTDKYYTQIDSSHSNINAHVLDTVEIKGKVFTQKPVVNTSMLNKATPHIAECTQYTRVEKDILQQSNPRRSVSRSRAQVSREVPMSVSNAAQSPKSPTAAYTHPSLFDHEVTAPRRGNHLRSHSINTPTLHRHDSPEDQQPKSSTRRSRSRTRHGLSDTMM